MLHCCSYPMQRAFAQPFYNPSCATLTPWTAVKESQDAHSLVCVYYQPHKRPMHGSSEEPHSRTWSRRPHVVTGMSLFLMPSHSVPTRVWLRLCQGPYSEIPPLSRERHSPRENCSIFLPFWVLLCPCSLPTSQMQSLSYSSEKEKEQGECREDI